MSQVRRDVERALHMLRADQDQAMADLYTQLRARREVAIARNQGGIALLDAWLHTDAAGDPAEQAETWAYLQEALDADRPAGSKLFP